MRKFDDITPALQAVLRSWSTGDTTLWVSFTVDESKVPGIDAKWTDVYGTRLSAEKRRWQKKKGLPTAWAASVPVLGNPHKRQLVLMASSEAHAMGKGSHWAHESWRSSPPELSDFVIAKEPRDRRDYTWTWRIQERQLGLVQAHLTALVREADAGQVAEYTDKIIRFYPAFGGVRRQLRRMLNSARKLWLSVRGTEWPGRDPENLPAMVGFRKERSE